MRRCSQFTSVKCRVTIVTNDVTVVRNENPEHTHDAYASTVLAKRAVGQIKRLLADNLATPSATQATVISSLPEENRYRSFITTLP